MLVVGLAGGKEATKRISRDEPADRPGQQEQEQQEVALVGVQVRLAGGVPSLFGHFFDDGLVHAFPGALGGTGGTREQAEAEDRGGERMG